MINFFEVAVDTGDESFFECVSFSCPDYGGCEKSRLTICAVLSMIPGMRWWITTPFTFWLVLSRSLMPHWYRGSSHPTKLNVSSRKDKNFASEYNFSVYLSVISNSVSKQNLREDQKKIVLNVRNYPGPTVCYGSQAIRWTLCGTCE